MNLSKNMPHSHFCFFQAILSALLLWEIYKRLCNISVILYNSFSLLFCKGFSLVYVNDGQHPLEFVDFLCEVSC